MDVQSPSIVLYTPTPLFKGTRFRVKRIITKLAVASLLRHLVCVTL